MAVIDKEVVNISPYPNSITDLLGDPRKVPFPFWALVFLLLHQWLWILSPAHQQWHSRSPSVSH